MAVELEFINLVVRRDAIEARYDGGWRQFREDHAHLLGGRCWYDDHLFRNGAMSPQDMQSLVQEYAKRGIDLYREEAGQPVQWVDGCVVEWQRTSLPCDWIGFSDNGAAYLKGKDREPCIGRDHFAEPNS